MLYSVKTFVYKFGCIESFQTKEKQQLDSNSKDISDNIVMVAKQKGFPKLLATYR